MQELARSFQGRGCSKSSSFCDIIWLESLKPFVFLSLRCSTVYLCRTHTTPVWKLIAQYMGGWGGRRPPPSVYGATTNVTMHGRQIGVATSMLRFQTRKTGAGFPFRYARGVLRSECGNKKRPPPPSLALAVEIKKRASWLAAGEIGILSSIFLLLLRAFLCLSRIRGKEVGKYEFSVSRSVHTVC